MCALRGQLGTRLESANVHSSNGCFTCFPRVHNNSTSLRFSLSKLGSEEAHGGLPLPVSNDLTECMELQRRTLFLEHRPVKAQFQLQIGLQRGVRVKEYSPAPNIDRAPNSFAYEHASTKSLVFNWNDDRESPCRTPIRKCGPF